MADRRTRDPNCLHCHLMLGLERWYQARGQREGAAVVIPMDEAVGKAAEVIAELVHRAPTRPQRRQFERYARECLHAAFKSRATGELVPVDTGSPLDEADTGAVATSIANEIERLVTGHPTAAVYLAIGMVLGAGESRAEKPNPDGLLKIIGGVMADEIARRRNPKPNGGRPSDG